MTGNKEQGKPSCLCFAECNVEPVVVEMVLEAWQAMGIEASLQVLTAESIEQDQKKRRLELALERVRYEAEYTQRQYEAVDPCNRLVAAELEARWNTALTQVAEAETRLSAHQQSQTTLSEEERKPLLQLGSNLKGVWNDPSAPIDLKKRIIRTLINEIVVDVSHPRASIEMQIHWAGERGRFSWPVAEDQSDRVSLSHEELSLLLGGIDLTRTRRKNWYRKTVSVSEKE